MLINLSPLGPSARDRCPSFCSSSWGRACGLWRRGRAPALWGPPHIRAAETPKGQAGGRASAGQTATCWESSDVTENMSSPHPKTHVFQVILLLKRKCCKCNVQSKTDSLRIASQRSRCGRAVPGTTALSVRAMSFRNRSYFLF